MYAKKGKGYLWKWTGIFFAVMLLFTILSRAVYQNSVIVVTTAAPSNGTIAHRVTVSGKTIQNQELAVTTVGGLRIAGVYVNEGQQVKKGDVLFTLDLDYLQETIAYQQQEMQKQKLYIQDAWSQSNAAYQQRSNAQEQAQENYNSAVSSAQTAVDRAERDLERAKSALEAFYNGESADQAEEELLTAACRDTKAAYDAAVLALEQLNQQIDAKIQEAIQQAESELQAAPAVPETVPQTEPTMSNEDSTSATEETVIIDPPVPQSMQPKTLSQGEIDAITQDIRAEYASAVLEAETLVQQTQRDMQDANTALNTFRQEQTNAPARSEEDLIAAVEQAQEIYDDAITALNHAKTTYGRAIESSELPTASNSTAQIGQITYDQMALTLEKLTALQDAGGNILAPVDGIVTATFVQTGEKTSEATAIRLADLSQGCKFTGLVSEEQCQYIGVGDKVVIQGGNNGKVYKDLPVTTFAATEEATGGYRITVQLPPGSLSLGVNADLQYTKKSQPYAICVPLSALHLDDINQAYVLVLEEVNTVLGTQTQAKKVTVTVLDQNETMAALEEGSLGMMQQIIVGSSQAVEPGSRVRVE